MNEQKLKAEKLRVAKAIAKKEKELEVLRLRLANLQLYKCRKDRANETI